MKYFGTDGIRGKSDIFTKEFVSKAITATCEVLNVKKAVVARDTRVSGKTIEEHVLSALASCDVETTVVGMTATPILAYATRELEADVGIMISASHNAPEYNGIKFFNGNGAKISTETEVMIEKVLENARTRAYKPVNAVFKDIENNYVSYVKNQFTADLRGLKVVMDTANGATSLIAQKLFKALGAEVTAICCDVSGENINVNSGATHVERILEECKTRDYDIAFSFDGDGDRIMVVKNGVVYDGDDVIYVITRYLSEFCAVSIDNVVGTIMSGRGVEEALVSKGINFVRVDVGDKFVIERMEDLSAKIGGENSGHIIIKPYQNTGDGLLVAVILSIIAKLGIYEILYDIKKYPRYTRDFSVSKEEKEAFLASHEIPAYVEMISAKTNNRIVVRASGTENKIRIMCEGEYSPIIEEISGDIKSIIKQEMSYLGNQNNVFSVPNIRNLQSRPDLLKQYVKAGVVIIDPYTIYVDDNVKIGKGSVIYPMNVITSSVIGDNVRVQSYSQIENSEIGDNCEIRASCVSFAKVKNNSTIGPFAYLRKGANVGNNCRVGDFVEIKNAMLLDGVKVAHLSYVGDAEVGAGTNVGCGTVFANYNGKIKQRTRVGSGVFIGANTNLVAPIIVGDNAYIGAGSTITDDVPSGALSIARARQVVKTEWKKP